MDNYLYQTGLYLTSYGCPHFTTQFSYTTLHQTHTYPQFNSYNSDTETENCLTAQKEAEREASGSKREYTFSYAFLPFWYGISLGPYICSVRFTDLLRSYSNSFSQKFPRNNS